LLIADCGFLMLKYAPISNPQWVIRNPQPAIPQGPKSGRLDLAWGFGYDERI
jgi:hypothetical protein